MCVGSVTGVSSASCTDYARCSFRPQLTWSNVSEIMENINASSIGRRSSSRIAMSALKVGLWITGMMQ